MRSYELFARYVMPRFQGSIATVADSNQWCRDNRKTIFGPNVAAIRKALDGAGFSHIPIMSYAAKFASAFYGPFREAAGSTPQFGDRQAYQMAGTNGDEAMKEIGGGAIVNISSVSGITGNAGRSGADAAMRIVQEKLPPGGSARNPVSALPRACRLNASVSCVTGSSAMNGASRGA